MRPTIVVLVVIAASIAGVCTGSVSPSVVGPNYIQSSTTLLLCRFLQRNNRCWTQIILQPTCELPVYSFQLRADGGIGHVPLVLASTKHHQLQRESYWRWYH